MFRRATATVVLLALFMISGIFAMQPNKVEAATAQKGGSMHFLQCRQFIGNKDGAARYTIHLYGQNDTNSSFWIGAREYPSGANSQTAYIGANRYFDYSYGSFVVKDRVQFYLTPSWGSAVTVQNLAICKK